MQKIGFLFDLDGTLIDSQRAVVNSWTTVAKEAGIPLDLLTGFHGIPAEQTLKLLLADRNDQEIKHWVRRLTDLEIADIEGVTAIPGALNLLHELDQRLIPWTIVTSCTTDLARARTTAANIPFPHHAVTFDQVPRGKPFPDPFILGAERLRLESHRCWAIEDAPGGVKAAKEAGCVVAAVLTTHDEQELHQADHYLESLDELLEKAGL